MISQLFASVRQTELSHDGITVCRGVRVTSRGSLKVNNCDVILFYFKIKV